MTCPTCADVAELAGSGFLFVDAAAIAPKLRWARPMLQRPVRRCDHPDRAELLTWLAARKRRPRGWRDLPGSWVCAWCEEGNLADDAVCGVCGRDEMTSHHTDERERTT